MANNRKKSGGSRTILPSAWDNARLAPFVLLRGSESALIDIALARLRDLAKQVDSSTEFSTLDARDYESGMLSVLTSPSLFGEAKLLIIGNLDELNADLQSDLLSYVDQPADNVWIVAVHRSGVRGKAVLDKLSKLKTPTFSVAALDKDPEKIAFLQSQIAQVGGQVSPQAITALLSGLGSDLSELLAVTKQLLSDCMPRTVEYDDAHRYLRGRTEVAGFDVADAVINGNAAYALELSRYAIAGGTQPLLIVAALAQKLRQLAKVAGGGPGGPGTRAADGQLGMHPYVAKLTRANLRNWDEENIGLAIMLAATADEQVKGASLDPQYAVERMILEVCRLYG